MTQHQNDSPYARVGANLIDQGYAAIPCRPGFKVPGVYGPFKGWANQMDWTQFCDRLPTDAEIEKWSKWPDAGVCIALGFNDVVAVDIDSDDPAVVGAIEAALGDLSWVQKAGRKGYTSFYRARQSPCGARQCVASTVLPSASCGCMRSRASQLPTSSQR